MTTPTNTPLRATDPEALRDLRLAANDYQEMGFGLDVLMPLRMARVAVELGMPAENVGALLTEITDGDTQWLLQISDAACDMTIHPQVHQAFLDSVHAVDLDTGVQASTLDLAARLLKETDGVQAGPDADQAVARLHDLIADNGGHIVSHRAIVLASEHTTGISRLLLARGLRGPDRDGPRQQEA